MPDAVGIIAAAPLPWRSLERLEHDGVSIDLASPGVCCDASLGGTDA